MPTFRRTRAVGAMRAHSERDPDDDADVATGRHLDTLREGLRVRGLCKLVVKPHPMDAEDRRRQGVVVLTDDDFKGGD